MRADMREYLRNVLELARPYRSRMVLGLLCGVLSGVLAPTLGLSLKLAVDAIFPPDKIAAGGAGALRSGGIKTANPAAGGAGRNRPGAGTNGAPAGGFPGDLA